MKSRIAKDSSELAAGTSMDDVSRESWPEIQELESPEAQTEGVAKSADRTNPRKQPGTTGEKSMPYPSVEEMRASQKRGAEGRGLPENSVDKLNECQGHDVDIKE